MARAEFADRCVTTPPRGLETQISSDLQRLTQSPQHQRNCHSENQARWHFFKAQSSTAANCAAHSRISNEIPTFDAIFSMAASVLFRVLAMRGSGCFLAANFRIVISPTHSHTQRHAQIRSFFLCRVEAPFERARNHGCR